MFAESLLRLYLGVMWRLWACSRRQKRDAFGRETPRILGDAFLGENKLWGKITHSKKSEFGIVSQK